MGCLTSVTFTVLINGMSKFHSVKGLQAKVPTLPSIVPRDKERVRHGNFSGRENWGNYKNQGGKKLVFITSVIY